MSGPPLNPIYYPFAAVPSTSNTNVFPFDIVINEAFPGLIFDPTETSGVYSVIREVNGCLWFVVNADWDATTLQWTQEDPTNPNVDAYAMEMCQAGSWQWRWGPATSVPGNPITWTTLFNIDDNGSVINTPKIALAAGDPAQQINPIWNAGSASVMVGRNLAVTDTSSSVNSVLDNLAVNGTPVWTVNKFGLLTHGTVPASSVVDLFVNPTFTGTSTFTGPVIMDSTLLVDGAMVANDGISINAGGLGVTGGLSVVGGETTDTLHVTGAATVDSSLTANSTLFVAGSTTADGGLTVVSGATIDTLSVTAGLGVGGTSNLHNVVLAAGDTITVSGTTPVVSLQSTDSSITITQTSPVEYNIRTNAAFSGLSYPIGGAISNAGTSGTSLTIPSVGTVWLVTSFQNVLTSNSPTGSLTVTGTGGTAGGSWAGGTDSISNVQPQTTLQLNGFVHAGDTITATVTATGGATITTTNMQILAVRQT